MTERLPRYRTNNPELDQRLVELLDAAGAVENRDQLFEILASAVLLGTDGTDRLDLKITNAALKEMRNAFNVFAPYRHVPKVTMFGSARTLPDDPLYGHARELAAALAAQGWMVVTGAGPGIMAAGLEGAGRDKSFGINIRLPFEQGANEFIAGDPKLVEMKYFFTRKLMLMKESDGFVCLPGGYGTLDEMLELLTLVQTGKAEPAPIVLLDLPGGDFWSSWARWLETEVATRGLISPDDNVLYRVTDDVYAATHELLDFYRNYHSLRYVGEMLVMRLRAQPSEEEVAGLDAAYRDICASGGITAIGPTAAERHSNDNLDLARIGLRFDRVSHGRLRELIDAINNLPSAPPVAGAPEPKQERDRARDTE
jgi:uncharacterized protein (TIGR00730 family)